jgi:hypothetical protein
MRKTYTELANEMASSAVKWQPGMSIKNSNGDIAPSTLGYQYTIQTTTLIRAKVIEQKFYEVPPADFVPIVIGEGAWLESIQTNLVYDSAGDFEDGVISLSDPSDLAQVSAGLAPVPAKIVTWAKGYQYSTPEVDKALAANNWDVITAKQSVLKRNWDLGIQKIAFLGMKSDLSGVPGLLSNTNVNVNSSIITQALSSLNPTQFAAFVQAILADYFSNSNSTVLPDTFVIPMDDFLGLGVPVSASFPNIMMIDYLLESFRKLTGNANFQLKGVLYGKQSVNAGYWATLGTNRYCLYRKNPETIRMDLPVDFILNAPNTGNNFLWEGVGVGQLTGAIAYRPAEIRYYDWAA